MDADGNGVVSPGDTLAYSLSVKSVGTQIVTGIVVSVPTPAGTSLGRRLGHGPTQGTPVPGTTSGSTSARSRPFQEDTIEFRLKVDHPLPAGITSISHHGTR